MVLKKVVKMGKHKLEYAQMTPGLECVQDFASKKKKKMLKNKGKSWTEISITKKT